MSPRSISRKATLIGLRSRVSIRGAAPRISSRTRFWSRAVLWKEPETDFWSRCGRVSSIVRAVPAGSPCGAGRAPERLAWSAGNRLLYPGSGADSTARAARTGGPEGILPALDPIGARAGVEGRLELAL